MLLIMLARIAQNYAQVDAVLAEILRIKKGANGMTEFSIRQRYPV